MTNAVSQAMAHELDRVALYGSGSANEPSGLTTLITPTYLGTTDGAAPFWDTFVDARVTIESNSYATPSAIMAPRTEGTLATLEGHRQRSLPRCPAVRRRDEPLPHLGRSDQ